MISTAMEGGSASFDRTLPGLGIVAARGIFYLLVMLLIAGIAWSAIARVNIVVRADGRLAPMAEPVRLSVPQGGVVSTVLVEVGAKVRPGQSLLEIDSFREAAETAADRHELEEARAESIRYEQGATILAAATTNLSQELVHEHDVLQLMLKQAEEMQKGLDGGGVSLFELQAKEQGVAETRARISQLQSDLIRSQGEAQQNRRLQVETLQKIKVLEVRLSRDLQVKEKTLLVAPVEGVVATISSLRPGRYLAPNEVAATILPGDEPLMAEVWIPNTSMRRVKPSLPVRMKVKAYPYQQFGLLPGTLVSVDPDADDAGTYRAWVRPARLTMEGAHGAEPLRPGLALTAELVVDRRSILEVLLDPIRSLRRGYSLSD